MTKLQRRILYSVIPVATALTVLWFLEQSPGPYEHFSVAKGQVFDPLEKAHKSPDLPLTGPAKIDRKLTRMPASVPAAPYWKSSLEKSLVLQGKGRLKKAEIELVDSFMWKVGKVDLPVSSLLIKIESHSGKHSSFRAMVDSSNGKIIQTWDAPKVDNFNPSDRMEISAVPLSQND